MTTKRLTLLVGGVLGALLIAVLVVGILILNKPAATEEERVAACMAQEGYPLDQSLAESGGTVEGLRAAGEKCGMS